MNKSISHKKYLLPIIFLFLALLTTDLLTAQNQCISRKAKQVIFKGQLIGMLDPPPPPKVIQHFKYIPELKAKTTWVTSPIPIEVKCLIDPVNNGFEITLLFDEYTTDQLKKKNICNLLIRYEFYTMPYTRKFKGHFKFDFSKSKNNQTIPQTTFMPKGGFIVSDPEELSIFLISKEIDYYVNENFVDTTTDKEFQVISNLYNTPSVRTKDINDTNYSIFNGRTTNLRSLGKIMSLYNYSIFYLSDSSFFSREASSLLRKIDTTRSLLQRPGLNISGQKEKNQLDTLNYYDSLREDLNSKIDAYELYLHTKTKLTDTKQKIEGIITRSYLRLIK